MNTSFVSTTIEDLKVSEGTSSSKNDNGVVYWALNNYGVTMLDIVIGSFSLTVAIAVMVLNILVVDAMVRLKSNFEPTDVLVCSLALSDFLSGVILVYNTGFNLINFQISLECLIRTGFLHGLGATSVLHLGVLTVDRYVKIILPYRYHEISTVKSMLYASVLIWLVSLTISFAPAMGWNVYVGNTTTHLFIAIEPEDEVPVCSYFGTMHPEFLTFAACIFFLPLVLMIVLYLHIFQVANRHARAIVAQGVSGSDRKDMREGHTWKYTKTVLILMGLYTVCWTPTGLVVLAFLSGSLQQYNVNEQGLYMSYAIAPGFANSLVNPIVYAFKITAVQRRFKQVFGCLRCCKQSTQAEASSTMITVTSIDVDKQNGKINTN